MDNMRLDGASQLDLLSLNTNYVAVGACHA